MINGHDDGPKHWALNTLTKMGLKVRLLKMSPDVARHSVVRPLRPWACASFGVQGEEQTDFFVPHLRKLGPSIEMVVTGGA